MGHVDSGHAQFFMQMTQFDLHLITQLFVERRQRFVHQQNPRLKHNGAGDCDTLFLSAGKLVNAPVPKPTKLHSFKRLFDTFFQFAFGCFPQTQWVADISRHGHMWKQRIALKRHANFAQMRRRADDFAVAELEAAAIWPGKSSEHHQKGGFSRSRRAEKGQKFATFDFERNIIERVHRAISLGDVLYRNWQSLGGIGIQIRCLSEVCNSGGHKVRPPSFSGYQDQLFGQHFLIHLGGNGFPFGIPGERNRQLQRGVFR